MPDAVVRPFQRSDRDQLTSLVNAHIAAVLPGGSISTQGLLSHLEADPGEFIVDPWVVERTTLVAEQNRRLVGAAHLLRYGDTPEVSEHFRGAGEIRWLLFLPPSNLFPDTERAADLLIAASLAQHLRWRVREVFADGTLPAPAIFGVPDQWPHVRELYRRHGFSAPSRTELVFLASIADIRRPVLPDLQASRSVGINGTRITANLKDERLGYIEVDSNLDAGARMSRFPEWADIGNLEVTATQDRESIASWLLGQAADWLDLAGITKLLDYADEGDNEAIVRLLVNGFKLLTSAGRGYRQTVSPSGGSDPAESLR